MEKNRTLLALGYHAVSDAWRSHLAVTRAALRAQLGHLAREGFVSVTATEAERMRAAGSLPARAVVITFDDGYLSTLAAKPLLDDFGFCATVFVVTRFIDTAGPLRWYGIEDWRTLAPTEVVPLAWKDLESLQASQWEVGSHTVNHRLLSCLDDEALANELTRSRKTIADRLGHCTSIAYPYGLADERISRAARAAGYETGLTLTYLHRVDEPLRRPRVALTSADVDGRLVRVLSAPSLAVRRSRILGLAHQLRGGSRWLPARAGELWEDDQVDETGEGVHAAPGR